jgi:hypothetical protein
MREGVGVGVLLGEGVGVGVLLGEGVGVGLLLGEGVGVGVLLGEGEGVLVLLGEGAGEEVVPLATCKVAAATIPVSATVVRASMASRMASATDPSHRPPRRRGRRPPGAGNLPGPTGSRGPCASCTDVGGLIVAWTIPSRRRFHHIQQNRLTCRTAPSRPICPGPGHHRHRRPGRAQTQRHDHRTLHECAGRLAGIALIMPGTFLLVEQLLC